MSAKKRSFDAAFKLGVGVEVPCTYTSSGKPKKIDIKL